MRRQLVVLAMTTGMTGCGLLLDSDLSTDADPTGIDSSVGDAWRDAPMMDATLQDVPEVEVSSPDAPPPPPDATVDAIPTDAAPLTCTIDLDPLLGMSFPLEDIPTACGPVDLSEVGSTVIDTVALDTAGVGYSVIVFGPDLVDSATLQLTFSRPAYDLELTFDWLSYDGATGMDERMFVGVDGTEVPPDLISATEVYAVGTEIHARMRRGRGRIHVPLVTNQLTIRVNDFGRTSGAGIELHEFVWTTR